MEFVKQLEKFYATLNPLQQFGVIGFGLCMGATVGICLISGQIYLMVVGAGLGIGLLIGTTMAATV